MLSSKRIPNPKLVSGNNHNADEQAPRGRQENADNGPQLSVFSVPAASLNFPTM